MSSQRRLILASLLFAVLWTAGMIWWNSPMETARVVILMASGAIAGTLWYFVMRWWMKRSMHAGR
jgi:hypothetical protein